jgi:hypothetical protein
VSRSPRVSPAGGPHCARQLSFGFGGPDRAFTTLGSLDGHYLFTEVADGFTGRVNGMDAAEGTAHFDCFGWFDYEPSPAEPPPRRKAPTHRKGRHVKDIRQPAIRRSRSPGRLAALLLALAVMLGLTGGTALAAPDGTTTPARSAVTVPASAMDAVAAMQPSWNLGNTLDAFPEETSWGNPLTTRELLAHVHAQGRPPLSHRPVHHRRRVHEPRQAGGRLGSRRGPVRRAQRPPRRVEVGRGHAHRPPNANGTTSSLTIPTQYRGDVLATMHATYADDSNAGPKDWTPYQEFNATFSPDYPNSAIKLTPDFLNALRDGEPATLTFHFYSGATVTYHVTKSGTSVTGTAS